MLGRVFASKSQAFGVQLLVMEWFLKLEICKVKLVVVCVSKKPEIIPVGANLIYLLFRRALHLACANGHVDVVTYLVENKCKLNLFDNDNRSPLIKAVQCQQEKCAAILLEHGTDPNVMLMLMAALPFTCLSCLVILLPAGLLLEHNANIDSQNKEGYTPLILAVSEHHEEIVEFLLKKGADVHARDQCER
ncbi:PREDICTED: ankyrin repeat domain-containing protein 7-like [Ficedula albicollis]|uniref:Uncharacterized protein n=1 Tax=Ficedula albicollis TaxID=59894 RepID=A0A803V5U8_FICAL|nr:PREDICTED: ankyrin repeat domain-containing protein 7-like [Ficedula albicollis]